MDKKINKNVLLVGGDILIIDDEEDIRELVAGILQDENYETRVARDSNGALEAIEARRPSLIILDIWLQGSKLDGLELLEKICGEHPALPVIMISGHGNIETAVSSMKKGAYDFIEKPFEADHLLLTVERAIEAYRLKRENDELKDRFGFDTEMIGTSPAITGVRQVVERVAPTGSRVLITGPSGCGKELTARMLHHLSGRTHNPFITINAAAMAPERMEIELFGIEPGPDRQRKIGLFEQAHGGTLYIDEIADMPLETQSKILRVLVEQRFERVGGETIVQVDVRVISSSSKNLQEEINSGRLRPDLYHRLNVVPIHVPSLTERREDIPLLVDYFIKRLVQSSGLQMRRVGEDTLAALQTHDWPGNIRELRNNVERMLILASENEEGIINADDLPSDVGASESALRQQGSSENIISLPLREARELFEKEYLIAQINRFSGNISRTAAFIGMERSALHRKLKSLGVSSSARNRHVSA